MRYYILAPADVVTGGPELAHQMCAEICNCGYEAYMYYVRSGVLGPVDTECANRYAKYKTSHVNSHIEVDFEENIVIVPEGLADFVQLFYKAKIYLWWMSVDNAFIRSESEFDILLKRVSLNLTQSKYSENFLIEKGVHSKMIHEVSDYIGDIYGQFIYPAEFRQNIVLFNPKKGFDRIEPIIKKTTNIEWKPLYNLTEEEMVLVMQISKIYVDFGNHPGKDRIPREAASCGCCVITNKRGSAAFYEDVPIDNEYKIDDENDIDGVVSLINNICENYNYHFLKFNHYREFIKKEKEKFAIDVKKMLNIN